MATREIGRLRVTSGRIVAADPMSIDFADSWLPLAREVPRGDFPVELALAESAGQPTRIVCARVRFAVGPALCWEPARFATRAGGEDDAGYEVVHGAGCFFDAAACAPIDEATMRAGEAALARNRVDGWTWHVAALADANVVMFVSPEHCGYPLCYWGFDARSELCGYLIQGAELALKVGAQSLPTEIHRYGRSVAWLDTSALTVRMTCTNFSRLPGDFSAAGRRLSRWPLGPTGRPRFDESCLDVGIGFEAKTSMKWSSCAGELNCNSCSSN